MKLPPASKRGVAISQPSCRRLMALYNCEIYGIDRRNPKRDNERYIASQLSCVNPTIGWKSLSVVSKIKL